MSKKKNASAGATKKSQPAALQKNIQREPNQIPLIALLIIVTISIYASSLKNDWTNWDDEGYILYNLLVKSINLRAIFSSFLMGNYHPVTVLFQAIEYYFFNQNASWYHTISLVLHIMNALLLFMCIRLLT